MIGVSVKAGGWGDLLLLVTRKFVGISHLRIIDLVSRAGYPSSVIGRPVTISDGSIRGQ